MKRKYCIIILFVLFLCVGSIIIRNTFFAWDDDTGIRNIEWDISMEELEEKEEQQKDVTYTKTSNNQFVEYTQYLDSAVHIQYKFEGDSLETIIIYFDVDVAKDWVSILKKIYAAEGKTFADSKESKKDQLFMRTWQKNNNRYKLTCDFEKSEMYMTVCKN